MHILGWITGALAALAAFPFVFGSFSGGSAVYQLQQGAFTQDDINQLLCGGFGLHSLSTQTTANGSLAGRRMITVGSALAITLSAPVAGADDGKRVEFQSNTAFAHTVTCTGHLLDGNGNVNTATFAAHAGAGFTASAYQGNWMVEGSSGVTFS